MCLYVALKYFGFLVDMKEYTNKIYEARKVMEMEI